MSREQASTDSASTEYSNTTSERSPQVEREDVRTQREFATEKMLNDITQSLFDFTRQRYAQNDMKSPFEHISLFPGGIDSVKPENLLQAFSEADAAEKVAIITKYKHSAVTTGLKIVERASKNVDIKLAASAYGKALGPLKIIPSAVRATNAALQGDYHRASAIVIVGAVTAHPLVSLVRFVPGFDEKAENLVEDVLRDVTAPFTYSGRLKDQQSTE